MDTNKPFFSVVIPLYNKQSHVKETIESALVQTFKDFEIIVVNDGSTDESTKVVEAIRDDRIRLIHQENSGVSVARNRGIKEAKAEYIAFLDADDLWMPGFLQTIHELIKDYPNAGLYATSYEMQAQDKIRKLKIKALPSDNFRGVVPNYFKSIVQGDYLVWTSAIVVPKKIFYDNNIWFPSGETRGEDQYVWSRIALECDIAYSTKVCSIYKLYTSNSTSGSECDFFKPRKFLLNLKSYRDHAKNEELKIWLDKFIEREIFNTIKRCASSGNRIYAIKQIKTYKMSSLSIMKICVYLLSPIFLYEFAKNIKTYFIYRRPKKN